MVIFPEVEEGKGPVLMLNMLKFRDKRLYFEEYIPAFTQVVNLLGIPGVKVSSVTEVLGNILAADDESWDMIALVEYPSAQAFKTIATSDAYRDIAEQLRLSALQDLKLFMTRKIEF